MDCIWREMHIHVNRKGGCHHPLPLPVCMCTRPAMCTPLPPICMWAGPQGRVCGSCAVVAHAWGDDACPGVQAGSGCACT